MNLPPNPLLDAALEYASHGWRVVPLHNLVDLAEGAMECSCQGWRNENRRGPCPTPGKHPRFYKFFDLASIDPEQIRKWWKVWPRANVGIIGGKASGIWALDTDPRNGGEASRDSLVYKHGRLPYTMTARTGGGGTHEYFLWPDFDLPPMMQIDDGLEVIAEGHVIVAAPSRHRSGNTYAWEPELGPDEMLPQPAPAWLLDILRAKVQQSPAEAAPAAGARGTFPPADIGKILSGCGWMRHCSDDAAVLSEPEWYAQLSVLGRCANGDQLAHELSRPHPEYSASETAAKLRRALTDTGPVTCAKVRHSLNGARFCDACPNAGQVKSPAVLGIRSERPPVPEMPADFVQPDDPGPEAPETAAAGKADVIPIDIAKRLKAVIDSGNVENAYLFAKSIASLDAELVEIIKQRLRAHFKGDFSARGFDRSIRSNRAKARAASEGAGGGDGGPPNWRRLLARGNNGQPKGNLANAITALRHAPEWKDVLWWNEFAERTEARKQPPIPAPAGAFTNVHDIYTTEWLQRQSIEVSLQITGYAVEAVAHDRKFHPPREYLLSLTWDGEPRIESWLTKYLGATMEQPPQNDHVKVTGYLEAVGAKWLISAVARIFRPGCKADCMLVLEGEQGLKKSSSLGALGGEWFTDQLSTMGTKDAKMETAGTWIIEIKELGSMSKAEIDVIKGFMDTRDERFRPPYGGRVIKVPRQCIFAGTVNPDAYLRDDTGGRRFWPVRCGTIDLEALKRDRDQLWAEARVKFDEGRTWWLDVPEVSQQAEREQAARYVEDPWGDKVAEYLRWQVAYDEVTVTELLEKCLNIPLDRWSQADKNRVVGILRFHGWRKKRSGGAGRPWVYRPATAAARLAFAKQETLVGDQV